MARFDFGKKKDAKSPVCACNGNSAASEAAQTERANCCASQPKNKAGSIKVLGSGCASCHALYENTQAAVNRMELAIKVEYITDLQTIMEYGVMRLPALVVNNQVVSMGRVLKTGNIQTLLEKLGV